MNAPTIPTEYLANIALIVDPIMLDFIGKCEKSKTVKDIPSGMKWNKKTRQWLMENPAMGYRFKYLDGTNPDDEQTGKAFPYYRMFDDKGDLNSGTFRTRFNVMNNGKGNSSKSGSNTTGKSHSPKNFHGLRIFPAMFHYNVKTKTLSLFQTTENNPLKVNVKTDYTVSGSIMAIEHLLYHLLNIKQMVLNGIECDATGKPVDKGMWKMDEYTILHDGKMDATQAKQKIMLKLTQESKWDIVGKLSKMDAVFTPPVSRTRQTAIDIFHFHDAPVQVENEQPEQVK